MRLLAPHLPDAGWAPTVVTLEPSAYEGRLDRELEALVPSSLPHSARIASGQPCALRNFSGRILGISIDSSEAELKARVAELAVEASRILQAGVNAGELRVEVNSDYLGGGYSVVGDLERDAIRDVWFDRVERFVGERVAPRQ